MKSLLLGPFLIGAVIAAIASPAVARTVEERLIAGLKSQGYVIVEDGYTLLGRLRIVAQSDKYHREIVVNPGTGEVLRDYAVERTDLGSDSDSAPVASAPATEPVDTPTDTVAGAADTGAVASGTVVDDAGVAAEPALTGGTVEAETSEPATSSQPDIILSEPAAPAEATTP